LVFAPDHDRIDAADDRCWLPGVMAHADASVGAPKAMIDRPPSRALLVSTVAAAVWIAFIAGGLLASLLLGWVALGILLLGGGPAGDAQAVPAILLGLLDSSLKDV
jgi:hypothetical protein